MDENGLSAVTDDQRRAVATCLGVPGDIFDQILAGVTAARSRSSATQTKCTENRLVTIYENQRCGGVGAAVFLDDPDERQFSSTKLIVVDPGPWTDSKGLTRPDPTDNMDPPPGWVWHCDAWHQSEWEYNRNFIGLGLGEKQTWSPNISFNFGKKTWVRRRRWSRPLTQPPDVVMSGWLSKQVPSVLCSVPYVFLMRFCRDDAP